MIALTDARRTQTLILLAVLSLTLVVFWSARNHEFVHYDDAANIYDNPHVASLDWAHVQWMFTDSDYARRYMPLGWLCYAVNRHWFGLNPHAMHGVNIALHLVNVALLFSVLLQLVLLAPGPSRGDAGRSAGAWCGGIATLFWAINPLRVEVVAWASGQIYAVAFLLVMIWLLAWLKYQLEELAPGRRRLWYWLSVAAYAASLLTYPLALFGPVLLLGLEVFPFRRAGLRWRDWFSRRALPIWKDKLPFLAVMLFLLALAVVARSVPDQRYRPVTLAEVGVLPRVMQAFYVWAYYVWKPWAPYDLAPVYPTLHAFNPLESGFLLSALAVVGISGAVFALRRRAPGMAVLWVCHLVLLAPVLGLSEYPHTPADRYSHIHGILWAAAIALGLGPLWHRRNWAMLAGAAVAFSSILFGLLAWEQVPLWRDSIPLYECMVTRMGEHPSRSRWDEALGVHYLRAGLTNAALASFSNAIAAETRRADRRIWDIGTEPRCHQRMGDVFVSLEKDTEAAAQYRASLDVRPEIALVILKYAAVLSRLGRDAEAIEPLQRGLRREPANSALHQQLALCLQKLGRAAEAEKEFAEAERLKSGREPGNR